MAFFAVIPLAVAQNAASSAPATTVAKPLAFDVVSIREDKGPLPFPETWDLRPDGYHWSGVPLIALIMKAYPPSQGYTEMFTPDELLNVPDWMLNQFYDVDVKVADTDMAAWKQPPIQKTMLQAMLADRLKLAAHYDHKPGQAYELHIAKGGAKFKPSDTNGTTIPMLCRSLRHMAQRPILDKTGLPGQYNMVLQLDPPGADSVPHDSLDRVVYALENLGLKLVPVKTSVETLVIDHVEQPSEN